MENLQKDKQTRIFEAFARSSPKIISMFHVFYYLFIAFVFVLVYLEYSNRNVDLAYSFGKNFGRAALLMLGLVVFPGILGRLRVEIKLTRIITLFRRQLGITVFLLALSHFLLVHFVLVLIGVVDGAIPYVELFKNFGLIALSILFFMFLTSNNFSVKNLGKWWKILHRFVYVAMFALVFHTALQEISVWSLFIFAFLSLEFISWIVYFLRKRQNLGVPA